MTKKFCVYCQEVTPHYVNKYGCFEFCNCEPLSRIVIKRYLLPL